MAEDGERLERYLEWRRAEDRHRRARVRRSLLYVAGTLPIAVAVIALFVWLNTRAGDTRMRVALESPRADVAAASGDIAVARNPSAAVAAEPREPSERPREAASATENVATPRTLAIERREPRRSGTVDEVRAAPNRLRASPGGGDVRRPSDVTTLNDPSASPRAARIIPADSPATGNPSTPLSASSRPSSAPGAERESTTAATLRTAPPVSSAAAQPEAANPPPRATPATPDATGNRIEAARLPAVSAAPPHPASAAPAPSTSATSAGPFESAVETLRSEVETLRSETVQTVKRVVGYGEAVVRWVKSQPPPDRERPPEPPPQTH